MEAPGKGLLKVDSILYIIFGAIATIFAILAFTGSAFVSGSGLLFGSAVVTGLGDVLLIGSIIYLIASVLELILGIVGVKKSDKPRQAGYFIVTGTILAIMELIAMFMKFSLMSLICLVLAVLYIVGGYMNKNAVSRA